MPRWARWLVVSVVAVLVLAVVVLALLPTFIDVNRYRDRVVAEVEARLGRQITLERLSLSFLPSPTLGLEGLVIGEPGAPADGAIPPAERFVSLERLGLRVRLWPLLRREVEVERLVLDRPQIVVERDARGNLSIADLLRGDQAAPAPSPGAPAGAPPGASPLAALLVERIEVRGGSLTFRDRAVVPGREVTTTLTDLDATLDDVSLDRPIEADLKATFLSRTPHNVTLSGRLGPVGPALDVAAAPADLSVAAADLDLGQVAAYVGSRAGASRSGAAAAPAVALAGTGGLKGTVKGTLGAPALDATADLTPAAVAYGTAFTKRAGVPFTLQAKTTSGRVGSGTPVIELNPLTLTLHTLTLTATGRVVNPASPALDLVVRSNEARLAGWDGIVPALAGTTLAGRATVEATVRGQPASDAGLDLDGTLRVAGLEVRNAALPQPLTNGEALVKFTGKGAAIEPLRAAIGQSTFTLRAEVPDYARRYVRFALESPRLDLDPLIAGAAATSGEPGGSAAASPAAAATPPAPAAPPGQRARRQAPSKVTAPAPAPPGAAVAGLSADGTVRVAQGSLEGVDFTDLRGELKLRDRVFTLEQLVFGLYGGQYRGRGKADLRGKAPVVDFASQLERVKADEILSDNTSLKGVIYGLLSANLDVKGSGLDAASFQKSLTGSGKFSLTDGRLASIDVLDRLQALVAMAKDGQPPTAGPAGDKKGTPVKSLSSGVRIDNGRFITPDLELSAGDFGLAGNGSLGFDHTLAYDLKAALPGPLARQILGRDVARLLASDASGRVEIPFRMGGTLTAPTFSLTSKFVEERLRARIEQELGENLEKNLQRGLDRLLKGGRREPEAAASPGAPGPGEAAPPGAAASPGEAAASAAPAASPSPKLDPGRILKDIFKR
jgi:AsmA protein